MFINDAGSELSLPRQPVPAGLSGDVWVCSLLLPLYPFTCTSSFIKINK